MRRLRCTRRTVPLERADEYLEAWDAVRSDASAAGCNAWLFRRTDHQDQFHEFLEWDEATTDAAAFAALERAADAVEDSFGYGDTTEWEAVRA